MIKVAIFTEGQTEMIFLRRYIFLSFDISKVSFDCFQLYSNNLVPVRFSYEAPDPSIYFLIVDVKGDETVVSAIRERGLNLIKKGYDIIIGIRDLYCAEYKNRSLGSIDDEISKKFIESCNTVLRETIALEKYIILFAIMEIEAWFLGMYNIFYKINNGLTLETILSKLNIDLKNVDPQKEFYRPSKEIDRIFNLIGISYSKSLNFIEMFTSHMETDDFQNAVENGRCENFKILQDKLEGLIASS
jgi:hypothetical protein